MQPSIWVEKYRSKNLNEVIFQDHQQEAFFRQCVEKNDIPHLLIYGVQGTGKTTTSKVLLSELNVNRADRLRINCSDEKIDALRSKVTSFALTLPLGKFKVVQLEELDMLSLDGQGLLRGLIEQASTYCRFIATCNYVNRVIPALRSRFQEFYFRAPDKEKIALRAVEVLEAEGVEFDLEDLVTYIDVAYPDIRKTIQLLQQNSQGGKLLSPKNLAGEAADWKFGLLETLERGDWKAARKLVCDSATREEHESVYTFLYQNLDRLKVKDKDAAIITIAEYARSHALVADTEINLAAAFVSLGAL